MISPHKNSSRFGYIFRKASAISLSAAVALTVASSAHAANLIVNGSFESTSAGVGQFDYRTTATGWSSDGYNFLFNSAIADTSGSGGSFGAVRLWGPNDGSNNGLTASPDGGNYVAADGAFQVAPITQTVTGLTIGQKYDLSFYWAGAQQWNYNGANTEQWKVTFGSEEHDTVVLNNANHGFTGWRQETFTFTATSSSQLLSFLAVGTPDGEPPFSLLDGVSMTQSPSGSEFSSASAPEPGALGLMSGGLLVGLGMLRFRKRKQ